MGRKHSFAQIPLGGALVQRTPVNSEIEVPSASLIDRVNSLTGENSGALGRANYAGAVARKERSAMTANQVNARRNQPLDMYGSGLYAGSHGHGLYASPPPMSGHGLHHHHHKNKAVRREKGSVGIHGNLMRTPQALTPQPYAVNFVWGNTLPPYYQKYNRS